MAAGGRAAVLTAMVLAAVLGACDDAAPPPPAVSLGPAIGVALYGRNSLATDMWVAVDSPIGQPQTVGFHARDLGVACWIAPTNASVVLLDQDPAQGGASVVATVGIVSPGRPLWVDVAPDGSVTTGVGVPAWWESIGGGDCPGR
jgi:hypothetical protein